MTAPVRIGLIGLGRFGRAFHLRRLLALGPERVALAGLCDPDPRAFAAARDLLGDPRLDAVPTCADPADLLDPARVDGVIVSTPNTAHAAPCRLALERGVPVMVDKPTAVRADEVAPLVAQSRASGVPFLTAFTRRFFPAVETVRARILAGDVGEVLAIAALQLGCPPNDRPQDGGFLHQRCVHLFDLVSWLTGQPVTSVAARLRWDGPWESFADMRLSLASGTQVQFLALADTAQNQDEVSVYGTRGMYRIQREALFVNRQRGPWEPEDLPEARASATSYFVDLVADAVAPGDEVLARDGADGLRALQILEAIKASGRTGEAVSL